MKKFWFSSDKVCGLPIDEVTFVNWKVGKDTDFEDIEDDERVLMVWTRVDEFPIGLREQDAEELLAALKELDQ